MTDHLPECIYAPEQFDAEQNIMWGGKPCICDALRACEQRVLKDLVPNLHLAEMQGYNRALTAAREAVAAADPYWSVETDENDTVFVMEISSVLATIDALRTDTPTLQGMEHINLAAVEDA